ncbi:hypothetical protein CHS0354_017477 [Potamilus streckersoni]|uniref:Uncharacterized protein n=1 Tax=Potamilus streckersoni TaxID=2493646 RepID=A0AAE0SYN0_9BIVA|nr:hypothetical protein CHS0354_017477 [Potamilus streckersoni]
MDLPNTKVDFTNEQLKIRNIDPIGLRASVLTRKRRRIRKQQRWNPSCLGWEKKSNGYFPVRLVCEKDDPVSVSLTACGWTLQEANKLAQFKDAIHM